MVRTSRRGIPFLLALFSLAPFAMAEDDGDEKAAPQIQIFGPPPPVAPEVMTRDENGRATLRATRISQPIVLVG